MQRQESLANWSSINKDRLPFYCACTVAQGQERYWLGMNFTQTTSSGGWSGGSKTLGVQKDGRKNGKKSTKIRENYTNQSIFLLWTIFKKSGRGTQKGIEVPKHSFQHFHTLYALWYSQLLYPIYLFFLFHNKAVLGQKVIFFTVNKESLYDSIRWQLLISTSLCYLYSNKKPNWQSNKNVKIRDDLKFALQIHLTFKRGDLLPMFC